MASESLTQEEMDCVILDAREGDLETLTEIFTELSPKLLLTIKDDITLSTPIHMASANGHFKVVEYLLSILPKEDAIKLANSKNDEGNTPLHWASYAGHLDVVELLVNTYEADAFLKNNSGHDSIFEAENNNQSEVETWYLKKFAIEDGYNESDLKIEEGEDGDTKITYKPGNESKEADDAAAAAAAANTASGEKEGKGTDEIEKKTEDLSI